MKDDPTSYDQVPYTISAFPMTHPCHLATVAKLFGVDAADPTNARVLEIGCGHGGNVLPMAEQLPNSQFVAIDLSETQIKNAKTIAEAAKLENIELIKKDLTTIDQEFGSFDYIIAHGVYSWVPDSVKEHILRICKENLTENGVAFVSYNTYPGWRLKESVRDMLMIHTERFEKPIDVLNNARGLLNFLNDAAKKQDTPYSKFIQTELELLLKADPHYFYHDTLEENNHPVYFKEFYERSSQAGLTYLGDSSTRTMLTNDLDPEVRATLEKATTDIITREQYLDFLRNRTFRQSLLCHQGIKINRQISADSIKALSFRSLFACNEFANLSEGVEVEFKSQSGTKIKVHQSFEKAVLLELQKASPKFLAYDDLINRTKHSLEGVLKEEHFIEREKTLFASLFNLYNTGSLLALVHAPNIVDYVSDHPTVSRLARVQAELGLALTNRYHGNCKLEKLQRQIVTLLNGENSIEDIVNRLIKATGPDKLKVERNGKQVEDPEELRKIHTAKVTQLLNMLAANALLIA